MQPIVLIATISVKPEYRQAFVEYHRGLSDNSRSEPGNLQYDLHQHLDDENMFTLIQIWRSQAAIDTHNASAHFQEFVLFTKDRVNWIKAELMHKLF